MLPLCLDQGVGVIPWSPLARGRLTRPWDQSEERLTSRPRNDEFGASLYRDEDEAIVGKVLAVAERREVSPGPGRAGLAARPAGRDLTRSSG